MIDDKVTLEQLDKDLILSPESAQNLLDSNQDRLKGWILEPTYSNANKLLKRFFSSNTYMGTADMLNKVAGLFKVSYHFGELNLYAKTPIGQEETGILEIRLGVSDITLADFRVAIKINEMIHRFENSFIPLKGPKNV